MPSIRPTESDKSQDWNARIRILTQLFSQLSILRSLSVSRLNVFKKRLSHRQVKLEGAHPVQLSQLRLSLLGLARPPRSCHLDPQQCLAVHELNRLVESSEKV